MPRYNPDFNNVDATVFIFDKGEYEFEVGKPKSFQGETKSGPNKGSTSIGVRYPMVCAEGKFATKRSFYTCYTHTDGSKSFAKMFIMASLGFPLTRDGEDRFNAEFKSADWSLDTDTGECGDIWVEVMSKHVIASVELGQNPDDPSQITQQWKRFRPVKAAVAAA